MGDVLYRVQAGGYDILRFFDGSNQNEPCLVLLAGFGSSLDADWPLGRYFRNHIYIKSKNQPRVWAKQPYVNWNGVEIQTER